MKKYIKEKYADLLLQICAEYKNTNRENTGRMALAVNRSLETLDKYSCYILGMGFMVDTDDIPFLKEYITSLVDSGAVFSAPVLKDVYEYLSFMEREDVF